MKWTYNKPDKPGWYWYRQLLPEGNWSTTIVEVFNYVGRLYMSNGYGFVDMKDGEWCLIPEPEGGDAQR